MDKKKDLPAMPFYIGDWKKDPAVQVLTREQKMIWFEMIMLMWESKERGYLTINGKPYTNEMLSTSLNLDNQRLTKTLTLFDNLGLYSKRKSDNAIYSRMIVKIIELSEKRKNAGKKGGNPKLLKQRLSKSEPKGLLRGLPNAETETETEDEIKKLWIRTLGRSPKIPEFEKTIELIKDFGIDIVYKSFKNAALRNIKSLDYLISQLDDKGNLKPYNKNPEPENRTYKTSPIMQEVLKRGRENAKSN